MMPLYLLPLGIKDTRVKIQGAVPGEELFLFVEGTGLSHVWGEKACSSLLHWHFTTAGGWYSPSPALLLCRVCICWRWPTTLGCSYCLYVLINTISVQRQDQGAFAGENSLKIIIDKRGGNGWRASVFLVPVTASVGVSTETPSGPPTS